MTRVAILGGRGYGGMELLRLLLGHPEVEVVAVTSRTAEGPVADVHGHLRGFTDLVFLEETAAQVRELARTCDVLFQAKPDGISATETPFLLGADPDVRVVDLSADFRLRERSLYPRAYGFDHPAGALLGEAVYGMPECGGRGGVEAARLVANPGGHAAAALLALHPLMRAGLLGGRATVTTVEGAVGGGAEPSRETHHPEQIANFRVDQPLAHPQRFEILQALGADVGVDLVTGLGPFARGLYAIALVGVEHVAPDRVRQAYAEAYEDEPFVRLRDEPPQLRHVLGTNLADLSVTVADGVACVAVALDDLGKGGAGTAVQNLNLLVGCPETTGLLHPGPGL